MAIKTIGVLGAGQMGSGIAQIAASKGYKVVLRDIKQEFCDNALAKMRAGLEKRVAAGKTTQEAVEATMANISTTVELSGVKDCDMVIEAAPEILDLKRSTFKELGEIVRDDCILCTNTSSMSITEIMSQCKNPERCAGMHFFFPPEDRRRYRGRCVRGGPGHGQDRRGVQDRHPGLHRQPLPVRLHAGGHSLL